MEKSAEHQQLLQGENKIRMFTPVQEETMCAGWTWYLANDFQFFLLSPVNFHFHILTLHWNHSRSLRCSLCWQPSWSRLLLPFSVPPFQPPGLQRCEHSTYRGMGNVKEPFGQPHAQVYVTDHPGGIFGSATFDVYYDKPWCRAGPYLVGLGTGWVIAAIRF